VLSSSSDESDVKKARHLGAREYFVKPHSLDELMKITLHILGFCLTTVTPDAGTRPSQTPLDSFPVPTQV
jgi:hypothetical protein